MSNYSERIDKVFGVTLYQHRTLRTVFDPYSSEWAETTIDKKIDILKKILAAGEDLQKITREYQVYYIDLKKKEVAKDVIAGLAILLQRTLLTEEKVGL